MAPWKKILLKAFGVGVGIGVGIAIVVGLYAWHASRPVPQKPWDANAITATFYRVDAVAEDRHLQFAYILENHTNEDFRTPTEILHPSVVVKKNDSLVEGKILKFTEEEIFLPPKQHAEIRIELLNYHFPESLKVDSLDARKKYREAVQKYVLETLPQLNGFAAFDDVDRYRINFPNGWSQPETK